MAGKLLRSVLKLYVSKKWGKYVQYKINLPKQLVEEKLLWSRNMKLKVSVQGKYPKCKLILEPIVEEEE